MASRLILFGLLDIFEQFYFPCLWAGHVQPSSWPTTPHWFSMHLSSQPGSWRHLSLQSHLILCIIIWLNLLKWHTLPSAQIYSTGSGRLAEPLYLAPKARHSPGEVISHNPPGLTMFSHQPNLHPHPCPDLLTSGPLPILHPSLGMPFIPTRCFCLVLACPARLNCVAIFSFSFFFFVAIFSIHLPRTTRTSN